MQHIQRQESAGEIITVGILNDYEVIVRGVAAMLEPYRDRVAVVEVDAGGQPSVPMDVALFDTFASRRNTLTRAEAMVRSAECRHVVLYTWDAAPPFLQVASDIGVAGIILKSRSADALVDGIERVVAGEPVGLASADHPNGRRRPDLSDRESEVLALIARGLTNPEIADELFLSVETVKTYVKRLYAKLDVHNRAQAAVAASAHQLVARP
jgi:DNA-binding NarL/FixJ family response regulator